MCDWNDVGCHVREGVHSAVTSQLDAIARQVGQAASSGIASLATFWMKLDAPRVADGGNLRSTEPVQFLQDKTLFIVFAMATVAMIIGGMRLAWDARGDSARDLLRSLLTLLVVTGAGTATVQLLAQASDGFALWLVEQSVPAGSDFGTELGKLVLVAGATGALPPGANLPFVVMMFFGIAVFLASLVQVLLMLIRSGMLVLLCGTLPLSAAMTNTEFGRAWFKKHCGWLIAFIAYKPAAALVYAAAFQMMQHNVMPTGGSLTALATGLMMLFLAVLALPALLRLVVPATAAVAGGSVGGAGAGLGAVASGARSIGGFGGGSRGGGPGGGGGGGGPSGSGGGSATGAIGVGAATGAVAGMASAGKKAAGGLSDAVSHAAGEQGGGGGASSGPGGSGRPGGRPGGKSGGKAQGPPPDPGPTGNPR
jgi:type IV secretion system protein TrbL